MLEQHEIGCVGDDIHVPAQWRFCFQASISSGMLDNILELCLKFHAALFEESYIGLTISQQFTLEIENVSFRYFFVIPFMEFIFACCGHTIRVVVRFVRHVPNIDLILLGIKEMGKKPFL